MRYWQPPVLENPEMSGSRGPDLAISQLVINPDHEHRLVYVAAVVVNQGDDPPLVPFCVRIGYLVYWDQVEPPATHQEFWWYPALVTLPFRTSWASMSLRYFDEGGDFYQIQASVDLTEVVPDRNRNNNHKFGTYWPFRPNLGLDSMGPYIRDTTTVDGKVVVKDTLEGKPVR